MKNNMLLRVCLAVLTMLSFFQAGCGQKMHRNQTLQIRKVSNEQLAERMQNTEYISAEPLLDISSASQSLGHQESESRDAPPAPCTGDFDWIQFKNGEWLKGEIKELLYDEFTFESDELDTLDLDWDDIYAVCSPKWNTIVLGGRTSVLGTLHVEGDTVSLKTSEGQRRYNREELQSIIPGGLTEWDYWSGKVSVGLTARSGNTQQSDLRTYLRLQRRSPGLRTLFESTGNYGSYEGVETINNQQMYLRHDIFVDEKVYIVAPIFQYYRDKFQNIDYRLTPGAGLGYQLIDKGDVKWDMAGGGGYQYTRFSRVEPGEDSSADGAALLAASNLTWDLTKKIDLRLGYNTTVGLSETVSDTHHALIMFSIDAWKDIDLDVSFTWDRVESPQPRQDGSVPDRDDFRLNLGIGWEF